MPDKTKAFRVGELVLLDGEIAPSAPTGIVKRNIETMAAYPDYVEKYLKPGSKSTPRLILDKIKAAYNQYMPGASIASKKDFDNLLVRSGVANTFKALSPVGQWSIRQKFFDETAEAYHTGKVRERLVEEVKRVGSGALALKGSLRTAYEPQIKGISNPFVRGMTEVLATAASPEYWFLLPSLIGRTGAIAKGLIGGTRPGRAVVKKVKAIAETKPVRAVAKTKVGQALATPTGKEVAKLSAIVGAPTAYSVYSILSSEAPEEEKVGALVGMATLMGLPFLAYRAGAAQPEMPPMLPGLTPEAPPVYTAADFIAQQRLSPPGTVQPYHPPKFGFGEGSHRGMFPTPGQRPVAPQPPEVPSVFGVYPEGSALPPTLYQPPITQRTQPLVMPPGFSYYGAYPEILHKPSPKPAKPKKPAPKEEPPSAPPKEMPEKVEQEQAPLPEGEKVQKPPAKPRTRKPKEVAPAETPPAVAPKAEAVVPAEAPPPPKPRTKKAAPAKTAPGVAPKAKEVAPAETPPAPKVEAAPTKVKRQATTKKLPIEESAAEQAAKPPVAKAVPIEVSPPPPKPRAKKAAPAETAPPKPKPEKAAPVEIPPPPPAPAPKTKKAAPAEAPPVAAPKAEAVAPVEVPPAPKPAKPQKEAGKRAAPAGRPELSPEELRKHTTENVSQSLLDEFSKELNMEVNDVLKLADKETIESRLQSYKTTRSQSEFRKEAAKRGRELLADERREIYIKIAKKYNDYADDVATAVSGSIIRDALQRLAQTRKVEFPVIKPTLLSTIKDILMKNPRTLNLLIKVSSEKKVRPKGEAPPGKGGGEVVEFHAGIPIPRISIQAAKDVFRKVVDLVSRYKQDVPERVQDIDRFTRMANIEAATIGGTANRVFRSVSASLRRDATKTGKKNLDRLADQLDELAKDMYEVSYNADYKTNSANFRIGDILKRQGVKQKKEIAVIARFIDNIPRDDAYNDTSSDLLKSVGYDNFGKFVEHYDVYRKRQAGQPYDRTVQITSEQEDVLASIYNRAKDIEKKTVVDMIFGGNQKPQAVIDRYIQMADDIRQILDEVRLEAGNVGIEVRIGNRKYPIKLYGHALPRVLSDLGKKELAELYNRVVELGQQPQFIALLQKKDTNEVLERLKELQFPVHYIQSLEQMTRRLRWDIERAFRFYQAFLEKSLYARVAYLESPRTAIRLPDAYIDWHFPRYIRDVLSRSWMRVEAARKFGTDLEAVNDALTSLKEQGELVDKGYGKVAEQLRDFARVAFGGREVLKGAVDYVADFLRYSELASKMGGRPSTVLANFFQRYTNTAEAGERWKFLNLVGKLGSWLRQYFPVDMKIVSKLADEWERDRRYLFEKGLIGEGVLQTEFRDPDANRDLFFRFVQFLMEPFGRVETGNLLEAARAASMEVNSLLDLFRRLYPKYHPDNPTAFNFLNFSRKLIGRDEKAILRKLARWGMDEETFLRKVKSGGRFTMDELHYLLYNVLTDTQFARNVMKSPIWFERSSIGRWLYLFKPWGLKQLNYIMKTVLTELRHGNTLPAAKFIMWTTISGEVIHFFEDIIRGQEKSITATLVRSPQNAKDVKKIAEKVLGDMRRGGVFGVMESMLYGDSLSEKVGALAFGPGYSTVVTGITELGEHVRKTIVEGTIDPETVRDITMNYLSRQVGFLRDAEDIWTALRAKGPDFIRDKNIRSRAFGIVINTPRFKMEVRRARQFAEEYRQRVQKGQRPQFEPTGYTIIYRYMANDLMNGDLENVIQRGREIIRKTIDEAKRDPELSKNLRNVVKARLTGMRNALLLRGPRSGLSDFQWRSFLRSQKDVGNRRIFASIDAIYLEGIERVMKAVEPPNLRRDEMRELMTIPQSAITVPPAVMRRPKSPFIPIEVTVP